MIFIVGFERVFDVGGRFAYVFAWRALIDVFSIRSVVAVGNVSRDTLARSGLSVPHVRHPAHGGREKFTLGLRDLLARGVIA